MIPANDIHILITGGLGFLGRARVAAISEQPPHWRVTILDNQQEANPRSSALKCGYVKANVTSMTEVQAAFNTVRPTAVVHAAGIVPTLTQRYSRVYDKVVKDVNIGGTRNILLAAKEVGVTGLVYTSSHCSVIDDFSGHYASECQLIYMKLQDQETD